MIYLLIGLGALLLTLVALGLWRPALLGTQGKTLWDWVALLLVPSTVGLGTATLSYSQYRMEDLRAKEAAVQAYVDRVGQLLLQGSEAGLDAQRLQILRAQTLTILHMVEGERAGRMIGFLANLGLLQALDLEFESLTLTGAQLKDLDLRGIDFEDSDLAGAELERSNLQHGDFDDSDLSNSDLKGADLRHASFSGTALQGAELDHSQLQGADLRLAKGLRVAQLRRACLDGTSQLPAGMTLEQIAPIGCGDQLERDD